MERDEPVKLNVDWVFPEIEYMHINDNNEIHCLTGPALKVKNGGTFWYYHGKNVSIQVLQWCNERNIKWYDLSDEDKIALSFAMKGFVNE